ncbi:ketopantoate reductase family protein [Leifsonia sp. Root112D2]|uniref:ketopantoate reductase family protein n=1 Tax=Leifsonia sp. Root112D2 TaxID=1736426 RepID=UPI0006F3FDA2|nr:2-dehydropantoate 2-reductase N-terminal domain-containing protein [Leifsonia sp. Root112D2]KQV06424.1 ketopantoate reductase [Leifsonia sp. Root112D2]
MKILMFGRGVIASAYGWALSRAGNEVDFYVRPGRSAMYGDSIDIDLRDLRRRPWGERVVGTWPVRYREELTSDHDYELIVVSVSHHRLAEAADFLAPRIGNATVLIFGNLWAEPLEAVAPLPADRLAWGFPGAGGGFGKDDVLRVGLSPTVVFGTLGQPPTPREQAVRRVFRGAGFSISEQSDIRGWLWIHFAFNAGMHSQGVRLGSLSHLIGAPKDLRDALLVAREMLPVVQKRGIDLDRHRMAVLPFRMPAGMTAAVMSWLINHIKALRTNLEAQSDPTAEEPRAICRDALADSRRFGVPVPRLEAAEKYFTAE